MIFEKSFWYADLVLKKYFLLSMFIVVLLKIKIFLQEYLINLNVFEIKIFCNKIFYCHFRSI